MSRDITKLHPFARMLAEELVRRCAKKGLIIKVTDCVRTKEEQDDCIKRGTSSCSYLYTYHAWGLAFDFCRNDGKGAYNEADNFFYRVGEIGQELGLEWGGIWKKVDKPHFQFDGFTNNENEATIMVKKYGNPSKFFKNADFKWTQPIVDITPKSSFKKILWLQVRLNIYGFKTDMDGIWGKQTIKNVKAFWLAKTGKNCTGERVSPKCIKLLAAVPK